MHTQSHRIARSMLALLALGACQPDEYVNPVDDNTGNPPPAATQIYAFDAATAPTFLDANLEATVGPTAAFMVVEGQLVAVPANGTLPDTAGEDANLLGGVGFGTYSNPDQLGAGVTWDTADPFKAIVEAEITLNNSGDQVAFCRSFATTCATVIFDPLGSGSGVGVVVLNIAANLPDTEIGEIAAGVSAAIRGSGDSGLTVAVTDESAVVVPFLATAGTPFTLAWSTERGAIEGSLDFSVSINGTELKTGNTAEMLAAAIVKDGGVALVYDAALNLTGVDVDYTYTYNGMTGDFTPTLNPSPLITGDLRLAAWSEHTPLKVFPTEDPAYELIGTSLSGRTDTPHAVMHIDGVYGAVADASGSAPQTFVYSSTYDGDDFTGTPLAGLVDQGASTGGGFFPSPSFCYSQILPLVEAQVRAGVRAEVHRSMYAAIGNGVLSVNGALSLLVPALNSNFGQSLTYTAVSQSGAITIGTDYADNNVDTNITTPCDDSYTPQYDETVSTTFVTQFNAFIAALEANNFQIRDALIGASQITLQNYIDFKTLQAGLNAPPGVMDGVYEGGDSCEVDDYQTVCEGYECNVFFVATDLINGTNFTGFNSLAPVPGLAAACEWGIPPSPAVDAIAATLTGNPATDHPAYAATAAVAATPPVRETASLSMNALVQGLFGTFTSTVYGPTIPASNFSVKYTIGDPASGQGPSLSRITITTE